MAENTINLGYEGPYCIVDTQVKRDTSVVVPELNGHQGDNQRVLKLAIKDGDYPHNLDGEYLALVGKDANGVPKASIKTQSVIKASAGYIEFTVPGSFYQATGEYPIAYFELRRNGSDQVISTINVRFDVMESGIIMTTGQSDIYNDYVDTRISYYTKKIDSLFSQIMSQTENSAKAAQIAQNAANALTAAINTNALAGKSQDNVFTEHNTFHGLTTIDNLEGPALNAIYDYTNKKVDGVTALINSITAKLGNVLRTDSGWTRDYTLGGCLSRANNGNDFALSKWHIMDNLNIIVGRGDVRVDNDQEYNESQIYLPWVVDNGDFAMSQIYFWDGYALPRLDINSKRLNISIKGQRHGINRLSLLIISFDR